jgi:hypothetical protein
LSHTTTTNILLLAATPPTTCATSNSYYDDRLANTSLIEPAVFALLYGRIRHRNQSFHPTLVNTTTPEREYIRRGFGFSWNETHRQLQRTWLDSTSTVCYKCLELVTSRKVRSPFHYYSFGPQFWLRRPILLFAPFLARRAFLAMSRCFPYLYGPGMVASGFTTPSLLSTTTNIVALYRVSN